MKISSIVAIALVAVCSQPLEAQKKKGKPPFTEVLSSADSAQYATASGKGTGSVAGQAFLTTRGGDVKKAAGRLVTLDPATEYAKSWFAYTGSGISKIDLVAPAPEFANLRRSTTADADGRFSFTELPPGTYVIRTSVTWEIPSRNKYRNIQGGTVADFVTVGDGENKSLVLNTIVP